MFDSFTKPGWQHPKPEVRLAAIDELDDEAVLLELVREDPETEVRARALSRISDGDRLEELAAELPQPLQAQARAQRLKQLLPDPDRISAIDDDTLLVRSAHLADEPEVIDGAIGKIGDSQTVMDLAVNHPVAKARLCAAERIEDIGQLKELSLQSKHHDKAVYRHCKDIRLRIRWEPFPHAPAILTTLPLLVGIAEGR